MFNIKNLFVYLCVVHNLNKGWIKNKKFYECGGIDLLFKAFQDKQDYDNRNLEDRFKCHQKPVWWNILEKYKTALSYEDGEERVEEVLDELFYYLELDFQLDSVLLEVLFPDYRERIQQHVKLNCNETLLEPY